MFFFSYTINIEASSRLVDNIPGIKEKLNSDMKFCFSIILICFAQHLVEHINKYNLPNIEANMYIDFVPYTQIPRFWVLEKFSHCRTQIFK